MLSYIQFYIKSNQLHMCIWMSLTQINCLTIAMSLLHINHGKQNEQNRELWSINLWTTFYNYCISVFELNPNIIMISCLFWTYFAPILHWLKIWMCSIYNILLYIYILFMWFHYNINKSDDKKYLFFIILFTKSIVFLALRLHSFMVFPMEPIAEK